MGGKGGQTGTRGGREGRESTLGSLSLLTAVVRRKSGLACDEVISTLAAGVACGGGHALVGGLVAGGLTIGGRDEERASRQEEEDNGLKVTPQEAKG